MKRKELYKELQQTKVNKKLIRIIDKTLKGTESAVRTNNKTSKRFEVKEGVTKEVFGIMLEWAIKEVEIQRNELVYNERHSRMIWLL